MSAEEDPRHAQRELRRDALAIGLVLALLAAAIVALGWAWRVERMLLDVGMALAPRAPAADVLVIAIDDASVAAIGRWPWRRAVHATLVERLAAAEPRAVMLDLVLSEPDPDAQQDALLARALRHGGPVVVPVAWYAPPGEGARRLDPAGALRDAVRLAQAEAEPDADGILRHAFLRAGIGADLLPHAALALLDVGGQAPAHAPQVERGAAAAVASSWTRDERLPIRYQGPPGHVARVSYVDVLTGRVGADTLRGKYLLVGATAEGLGDAYATPMGGAGGAMRGVEVVGQLLQSLRAGDTLRQPSAQVVAGGSALAVLLLVAAFVRLRARHALALALLSAAAALAASVALVAAGWWVSPIGFAAAALLAYPLWSWRRLESTAAALGREIERIDAETAVAPAGAAPRGDRGVVALSLAAARLRRARRFLAAGLDGLPEAVLLADAQGRVSLANRRAATLFEVAEPEELAGLELARLLGELQTAAAIDWPARLGEIAAQGGAFALPAQLAGQGDFLLSVAGAPDAGGPRLVAVCADIGGIRRAEREREEALAFVSHDLRSPLASIALLAEFQRSGLNPQPLPQLLDEFERLARRGLDLAEGFVRAAQAQSKPLEPAPVELAALLAEVARDLEPQARARQMHFVLDAGAGRPAHCDRELVMRALGNLAGNAVKYAPAGSAVTLGCAPGEGGHLLWVRDQGPGLPAATLATLFRGYARAGASAAQAGVGLGLQFVQRVAERHGGWVRVHSEPGEGARFEIFLPEDTRR